MSDNPKSDVDAKVAFARELRRRGYEPVVIMGSPADISAYHAGQRYYFEVKYTSQQQSYFGAATLTEWETALANQDRFTFVVAIRRNGTWIFHEYSPTEFMEFSYVPPFKIFFSIPVGSEKALSTHKATKSIRLTVDRLRRMSELYKKLRSEDREV